MIGGSPFLFTLPTASKTISLDSLKQSAVVRSTKPSRVQSKPCKSNLLFCISAMAKEPFTDHHKALPGFEKFSEFLSPFNPPARIAWTSEVEALLDNPYLVPEPKDEVSHFGYAYLFLVTLI